MSMPSARPDPVAPPPLDESLRDAQAHGHARSIGPATVASLGAGAMSVWALLPFAGWRPLLAWFGALLLVQALRWWRVAPLRTTGLAGMGRHLPMLRAMALLHGLAWGALPFTLDTIDAPERLATLVVLVGGMSIMAMTLVLVDRISAAAFVLPALLPLVARLPALPAPLPRFAAAAAVMLMLLAGAMLAAARVAQRSRLDAARSRQKEAQLLADARHAEAVLRRVFEHVGEGLCMVDAELRLVAWNRRIVELMGVDPELVQAGMPLRELVVTMGERGEYGDIDPQREADRRLSALTTPGPGRTERVRPNGHTIELRRYPLPEGGFTMVAVDITERRASQSALAENRRMMTLLLANMQQGAWFVDNDMRTTDLNPAMCQLLGLPREAVLGRPIYDFVDAENAEIFRSESARRALGESGSYEVTLQRADGTQAHCHNSATPLFDEQGRKIGSVGLYTDISAYRQAMAELQRSNERAEAQSRAALESESRFRALADAAPAFIWMSDARMRPMWFNQTWLRCLGLSREDALAQGFRNRVHPDDLERCRRAYREAFEVRQRYELEFRLHGADGRERWLADIGVPRFDSQGRFEGFVSYGWDVTDRQAVQAALTAARDEAERANRAKSDFLSRMSHELRTPLNAVLGFAQLLEADGDEPLARQQRERVQQILRGGAHLLELINEVLDLARIEAGSLPMHAEPVALDALVQDCRALVEPAAQAQGVILDLRLPGEGLGRIHGDPTRLRQVLLNLLSNAIKYNRAGGQVRVQGRCDGERVRLEVHDTGQGLTAEQQQRLFQAFDRLDADRGGVEGTGIGLALSKALVDLMHGRIGVDSRPGEGSCFWVELPRGQPGHGGVPAMAAAVAGAAELPAAPAAPAQPRQVLYIEDNPVNQILMDGMLRRVPGVLPRIAEDPEHGLDQARAEPPDLVLLDIQLPGLDGYEVLQRLRADPATAAVPVIAVTANAMPEDVARARAAGFDDYLTKPVDLRTLVDTVQRWLERGEPARG